MRLYYLLLLFFALALDTVATESRSTQPTLGDALFAAGTDPGPRTGAPYVLLVCYYDRDCSGYHATFLAMGANVVVVSNPLSVQELEAQACSNLLPDSRFILSLFVGHGKNVGGNLIIGTGPLPSQEQQIENELTWGRTPCGGNRVPVIMDACCSGASPVPDIVVSGANQCSLFSIDSGMDAGLVRCMRRWSSYAEDNRLSPIELDGCMRSYAGLGGQFVDPSVRGTCPSLDVTGLNLNIRIPPSGVAQPIETIGP